MNLTKFQVNAVKSMARGLAPLERRLKRLEDKGRKKASLLSKGKSKEE